MLQDLEAGKPLENEALMGAILEMEDLRYGNASDRVRFVLWSSCSRVTQANRASRIATVATIAA